MATIESVLEELKDPKQFAAKLKAFNDAEASANAAIAQARKDSEAALMATRALSTNKENHEREMRAFERRQDDADTKHRERQGKQDEAQARIDERTRSLQSEEASLQSRLATVQAREAEAANVLNDAKGAKAAADNARKLAGQAVANMRQVLADTQL